MLPRTKAEIFDFATRSFRDVADRDYIAARVCYRSGLQQQFLWMALQAVEKYLKGILLFDLRSTRAFSHNIKAAFDALLVVPDYQWQFPADIGVFIEYLQENGANRYFTYPYYTKGDELIQLDRVVWHLRRYCQRLRGELEVKGKKVDLLPLNLARIHHPRYATNPHEFLIIGGLLEKILAARNNPSDRRQLVWNNAYFGRRKLRVLRNFTFHSSSGNPTPFMHPGAFTELAKLVRFEKTVTDYFGTSPKP